MRKRIIYVIIIVVLLLTGCTIGGSFYMLNFSLTPDRSEEHTSELQSHA